MHVRPQGDDAKESRDRLKETEMKRRAEARNNEGSEVDRLVLHTLERRVGTVGALQLPVLEERRESNGEERVVQVGVAGAVQSGVVGVSVVPHDVLCHPSGRREVERARREQTEVVHPGSSREGPVAAVVADARAEDPRGQRPHAAGQGRAAGAVKAARRKGNSHADGVESEVTPGGVVREPPVVALLHPKVLPQHCLEVRGEGPVARQRRFFAARGSVRALDGVRSKHPAVGVAPHVIGLEEPSAVAPATEEDGGFTAWMTGDEVGEVVARAVDLPENFRVPAVFLQASFSLCVVRFDNR